MQENTNLSNTKSEISKIDNEVAKIQYSNITNGYQAALQVVDDIV